ncbi:hypothetical protein KL86CLO1_12548 [uncultured Eubacteriales bacterium]|uniref:Uncharacterized protein n=1 Tax=uncultured Eubacteriales bacterium TaxID=172733 RepID=A0A212KB27_9FIRM|nr:hypothetical protein KL86CLO1_12548 [uncultured Eubacteriales bacterium]
MILLRFVSNRKQLIKHLSHFGTRGRILGIEMSCGTRNDTGL